MSALLDDNTAIYVTDDRPNAEVRYQARFMFDPNSIPMTSNDAHYIFYGYTGVSTPVLRLELRFVSGVYQLRPALRNDASNWMTTSNWQTISDTAHLIEVNWQAATTAGTNNGALTFWIDSSQKISLNGVDNDTRRIDRIQLGAVAGIDNRTRGSYFFDAFTSQRSTSASQAILLSASSDLVLEEVSKEEEDRIFLPYVQR